MLLLFEVLSVAVLLAGVAFVFWPAALIVAGVLGVFAAERAQARPVAPVVPLRRSDIA